MTVDGLSCYMPEALAAAGAIIGTDGLPYPPMPSPAYRPVNHRNWRFSQAFLPASPGYFSGPRPLDWMNYILSRDGVCWMSLVPMEVESQMPHAAMAEGTVVVCGMGLGLMAYAVSARKAVDRLIVVERDPEVIEMFREFASFESWPQRAKVEIVQADAREFRMDGVDFLYADIWPYYRMECMVPDMQKMHANIPAPACGYWGQELDMVDHAVAAGKSVDEFSAEDARAFAQAVGLPLIGLEQPGYPELCRKAAINPAIRAHRIAAEA